MTQKKLIYADKNRYNQNNLRKSAGIRYVCIPFSFIIGMLPLIAAVQLPPAAQRGVLFFTPQSSQTRQTPGKMDAWMPGVEKRPGAFGFQVGRMYEIQLKV